MELWTYWLGAIDGLLTFLSSQVGLGTGLAIVTLTLLFRTALLPISWRIAFRGAIRQKKMLRLQPELASLKAKYGNDPQVYAQRMMKLYPEHDVTVMDWRSVLGALLAGLTTALVMMANPDLPDQMRLMLILVPSILAAVAALKFCSALAVYWTVSNCYSAGSDWPAALCRREAHPIGDGIDLALS